MSIKEEEKILRQLKTLQKQCKDYKKKDHQKMYAFLDKAITDEATWDQMGIQEDHTTLEMQTALRVNIDIFEEMFETLKKE